MHAKITYTQDRRYKKPIRIHAEIKGDDIEYDIEFHRRHTLRNAKVIGVDFGSRFDSFEQLFGTIEVSDVPPQIKTEVD